MLQKLRIGPRLILLIVVQLAILLGVGALALAELQGAARSTATLNDIVGAGSRLAAVDAVLRGDLLRTANGVYSGTLTWADGRRDLAEARDGFSYAWGQLQEGLGAEDKELIDDTLAPFVPDARSAMDQLDGLMKEEDPGRLELFLANDLPVLLDPFLNALAASAAERRLAAQETFADSLATDNRYILWSSIAIGAGALLAGLLGLAIFGSIRRPIARISATVQGVAEGHYEERTGLAGNDELGTLGGALDRLLDDRVASLVRTERENEQLNDSIISLLRAVSKLSQRDLTVRAPVTEDVTGSVADAINQLAEETGQVLLQVNRIAEEVGASSAEVTGQAEAVTATAAAQEQEVESTAAQLTAAAERLRAIAEAARRVNLAADAATQSTAGAVSTVSATLSGMTEIRETIQETGKRIKRLAERSQDIGSIVDIIKGIAERTTVLALNASMQAASAGEAGRGFAVVAAEVQRLAENARDATGQIGTLVRNIQVETSDTIATMDRAIGQVVAGSRLAEEAGANMVKTQQTTAELVGAIAEIATGSADQARIAGDLRDRAAAIQERTRATGRQLDAQLTQSRNLAELSRALLESVRVFKLRPGA